MNSETQKYNSAQTAPEKQICDLLARTIDANLKGAENKIWHRHPVWFLDGNPIVGYSKLKAGIRLMFWSGADFGEAALQPGTGKFKDASATYTSPDEVDVKALKRWLVKSRKIQWDYKNIMKNKGLLKKLPAAQTGPKKNVGSHDERMAKMNFATVYPLYLAKVKRKGRTQAELDAVITWLTGFSTKKIQTLVAKNTTFADFFAAAKLNAKAKLITGTICGVRIEEIENPLTQKARYLDKLVDELAAGKAMEKILRS
jgi:hypothetical protein